jgi:hypothetical protein
MASIFTTVAEALKDQLNAGTYSQSFTAIRSYATRDMKIEELTGLRVDVVPVIHKDASAMARKQVGYTIDCDIGIRKKFAASDRESDGTIKNSSVDPLVLLLEEIHESLIMQRLTTLNNAAWEGSAIRMTYSPVHLREWGQFTGIARITYSAPKALA